VWAAPRRSRVTVYLAGIAANVCLAGAFLLVLGLANPHGAVRSLLAAAVAETVLMLATQLMVFMRTDLYFVLQDLTGCANLYADGSAYLRYLGRRTTRPSTSPTDPSLAYPATERRAIRLYSVVLLAGTAICLGVECAVSLPALIVLLARAVSEIGVTPVTTLDGCAALTILLTWQALWAWRWWQRHRRQVRALARKIFAGERR
jgi:putative peptide zinc metalloprotease protein